MEGKVILVDLGPATGIVLPIDQIKSENYKSNVRMKFYLKSVEQTNKGPEILLSRTHPEMLRKLFKLEVPEINSGAVTIKSISRDAGHRAKIAVFSKEEGIDPVGACIGQRGTRIQAIINELGGEKIDVIEWVEDQNKFIANALAPAKIESIEIVESDETEKTDEDIKEKNSGTKTAKANVKDDQYSLAIGKGGQNVRLAAQLVGMRIDVVNLDGDKNTEEQKNEKTEEVEKDTKEDKK
jgi:N utilization substance protein A